MSRLDEIAARLERGIMPTESEVHWLLEYCRDRDQTIEVMADSSIKFFHQIAGMLERRVERAQQRRATMTLGEFDDRGGQFVDA